MMLGIKKVESTLNLHSILEHQQRTLLTLREEQLFSLEANSQNQILETTNFKTTRFMPSLNSKRSTNNNILMNENDKYFE